MPLYTATKSLNVTYAFDYGLEGTRVNVTGAATHAILHNAYNRLIHTMSDLGYTTDKTKGVNFGTAAVTVLYTDTTTDEGYLAQDIEQQTFHLNVPNQSERVVCSGDIYESKTTYYQPNIDYRKNRRDYSFNGFLSQRVHAFSAIALEYDLSKTPKSVFTPAELDAKIADPMFPEIFHHTEQAMMHLLSSTSGMQVLITTLQQCNAQYLYGIVLDIYTHRPLCCNCNACLLGMQNSHEQGFLSDLSRSLIAGRIEPRRHLMLSTRVSATKDAHIISEIAKDTKDTWHHYNSDDKPKIFQAENRSLGTEKLTNDNKYTLSTYKGTFFSSRKIQNKVKLEKRLAIEKKIQQQPTIKLKITRNPISKDVAAIKTALTASGLGINDIQSLIIDYCNIPKLSKK